MEKITKVYIATHQLSNNIPHIAGVYKSIQQFEKHKEEIWNGKCKFKLLYDYIGKAGLDYRTYEMELTTENHITIYIITIKGFNIYNEKIVQYNYDI